MPGVTPSITQVGYRHPYRWPMKFSNGTTIIAEIIGIGTKEGDAGETCGWMVGAAINVPVHVNILLSGHFN